MLKSFRQMFFEALVVAVVVGILYVPIWLFSYVDGFEHVGGVLDVIGVILVLNYLVMHWSDSEDIEDWQLLFDYFYRFIIPVVVVWFIQKNLFEGLICGGAVGLSWIIGFYLKKELELKLKLDSTFELDDDKSDDDDDV